VNQLRSKEILNSKGLPTVEVELENDSGIFTASVPAGISTGKYEAVQIETKQAIENIQNIIAPIIENEKLDNQKRIDETLIKLDGTKNKSNLGANAILPVSIAVLRAGAKEKNISLYDYIWRILDFKTGDFPKPSFNILEGGKHATSGLAFQEFMVVPQTDDASKNLEIGLKIYGMVKDSLLVKYGPEGANLSAEGAFSVPLETIETALKLLMEAIEKSVFKNEVKIAIDVAASEFYDGQNYKVDGKLISKDELLKFYKLLISKYPICSIEDPFYQEDFESFAKLKKTVGDNIIIFGDDLTVSNIERIKKAEKEKACSGLILKPNQIGTVWQTIEATKQARMYDWKIMVANRAGETEDSFIADLAVGVGAEFIKSGAPFPKERMTKYNRLIEIQEEIKSKING